MFYGHDRQIMYYVLATLLWLFLRNCYSFHNTKNYYFSSVHFHTVLHSFIQFYLVLYNFTQFSTTRKKLLTLLANIYSYKMLYFTEQGNIFVLIDWLIISLCLSLCLLQLALPSQQSFVRPWTQYSAIWNVTSDHLRRI